MVIIDRNDYLIAKERIRDLHSLEGNVWGLDADERETLRNLSKDVLQFEQDNPEYKI